MKKYMLAAIMSAVSFAAAAQYTGPTDQAKISAALAKQLGDDAAVTLEGKIERHIGKDKYLFSDASGSIVVEIDSDEWVGVSVSEKDKVRITGEVDKSWTREAQVDVDKIEIIK